MRESLLFLVLFTTIIKVFGDDHQVELQDSADNKDKEDVIELEDETTVDPNSTYEKNAQTLLKNGGLGNTNPPGPKNSPSPKVSRGDKTPIEVKVNLRQQSNDSKSIDPSIASGRKGGASLVSNGPPKASQHPPKDSQNVAKGQVNAKVVNTSKPPTVGGIKDKKGSKNNDTRDEKDEDDKKIEKNTQDIEDDDEKDDDKGLEANETETNRKIQELIVGNNTDRSQEIKLNPSSMPVATTPVAPADLNPVTSQDIKIPHRTTSGSALKSKSEQIPEKTLSKAPEHPPPQQVIPQQIQAIKKDQKSGPNFNEGEKVEPQSELDVPTFTVFVPTEAPTTLPPETEPPPQIPESVVGVIPLLPNPSVVDHDRRRVLKYDGDSKPSGGSPKTSSSENSKILPSATDAPNLHTTVDGQEKEIEDEVKEMDSITDLPAAESDQIPTIEPPGAPDPKPLQKTPKNSSPPKTVGQNLADENKDANVNNHIAAGMASHILRQNTAPEDISQSEATVQYAVEKIFEDLQHKAGDMHFKTQAGIKNLIGDILTKGQIKKLVGRTFTEVLRLIRGAKGGKNVGVPFMKPAAPAQKHLATESPIPVTIKNVSSGRFDKKLEKEAEEIEKDDQDDDDDTTVSASISAVPVVEKALKTSPTQRPEALQSSRDDSNPQKVLEVENLNTDSKAWFGKAGVILPGQYTGNITHLFVPLTHFLHNMKEWFRKALQGSIHQHATTLESGLGGEESDLQKLLSQNNQSHARLETGLKKITTDDQTIKHDYQAVYRWQYETYGICLAIMVLLIVLLVMVLMGMLCSCGRSTPVEPEMPRVEQWPKSVPQRYEPSFQRQPTTGGPGPRPYPGTSYASQPPPMQKGAAMQRGGPAANFMNSTTETIPIGREPARDVQTSFVDRSDVASAREDSTTSELPPPDLRRAMRYA